METLPAYIVVGYRNSDQAPICFMGFNHPQIIDENGKLHPLSGFSHKVAAQIAASHQLLCDNAVSRGEIKIGSTFKLEPATNSASFALSLR